MNCVPVLMMGFNRPDLTRGLLDCVRKACPKKLYFAVDGSRDGCPQEADAVAKVRTIAKEIDWPCEIRTRFRQQNMGCAKAIPDAISWFLSEEPYGIILEDDIRPTEAFFRYETELLERYRDDPRIGMVSGFNPYGFQTSRTDSYHFSNRVDIWGWGTWSRVWKDYSLDISSYIPKIDQLVGGFTDNPRMRTMMRRYIRAVESEPTTWDVQFSIMHISKGYLAAVPRRRMTGNLGLGDSRGVHTVGYCYDDVCYRDVWNGDEEIVHPRNVALDDKAVSLTERRFCGIFPRGLTYLGSKLPWTRKACDCVGRVGEATLPVLFRL